MTARRWDIFLRVVDNYGDAGVCWRLATQLAARGQSVRLLVDRADAQAPALLRWMAPAGDPGVSVVAQPLPGEAYAPADVVISAFGCELPEHVVAAMGAANRQAAPSAGRGCGPAACRVAWIVLEYLSAEAYAAQSHGLPSPVQGGAGAGAYRWFFFPGFTAQTGGLLREPGLLERQAAFDRGAWLRERGIGWRGETVLSLFCYEPPMLAPWIASLAAAPVRLLVSAGRAAAAVRAALAQLPGTWNRDGAVAISYLEHLPQHEFDHLLWAADLNLVRGEDSLVRALWAGRALVWQAYPQQDGAHAAKVQAFLDWLAPPGSLRAFMRRWNGLEAGALPAHDIGPWQQAVQAARERLLRQDDLVTRLLRFVAESR
jgi:uncharacterized repeat protein (TIGR03837 family)